MEIDFPKCYNAMETWDKDGCLVAERSFVRQAIQDYVMNYHRQLEEQLVSSPQFARHVHEHGFSSHGLTGYPTWQTPPHPTCPLCKKPLP